MRETNLVYEKGEHPIHGTWLSVDVIAFTEDTPRSKMVLITRQGVPHKGSTTLPGGLLAAWDGETVNQAARRIVADKVGVPLAGEPVVVDVISDPDRDERGHTVSIVVAVRVPSGTPGAVPVEDIPKDMPFDHYRIAQRALSVLRERVLVDTQTTYALLGTATTVPYAHALLSALERVPDATVRSRIERSMLYRRTERNEHGSNGRPSIVWVSKH